MSNTWVCPCNGCKKAQKVIIDQIIEEYRTCPNVEEIDGKLYCTVWYKHDDCERLRELLYKITGKDLYTLPEMRFEVSNALEEILKDRDTHELLRRLGSDYDKDGVPYWHRYEERLKYMEDNGI
jgi:hypothetical protein